MKTTTKYLTTSDLLAIIALFVSILSVYFSVFYKNHELTVSLIDSDVEYSGNKINVKLLYHNQGNTYSTIVQNYLVFYQDKDWENQGIVFDTGKQVFEMPYNPVILIPGEQTLHNIDLNANFSKIDTAQISLAMHKKILVGLVIKYINRNGLRTGEMFPIGYILLDERKKITHYKLEYKVFELDGDSFYKSTGIE